MKKIFICVLALAFCLAVLCGCSAQVNENGITKINAGESIETDEYKLSVTYDKVIRGGHPSDSFAEAKKTWYGYTRGEKDYLDSDSEVKPDALVLFLGTTVNITNKTSESLNLNDVLTFNASFNDGEYVFNNVPFTYGNFMDASSSLQGSSSGGQISLNPGAKTMLLLEVPVVLKSVASSNFKNYTLSVEMNTDKADNTFECLVLKK